MKRLFGAKKEKAPPPSLSDAVGELEGRGDSIEARIAKLDAQLGKYKAQIKKMRPGPAQQGVKRRALQVLKQKKLYEQQREQVYQQQFNVEQASFAADTVKANIDTVQAMKAAAKDFKQTFGKNRELRDRHRKGQDRAQDRHHQDRFSRAVVLNL